MVKRALVVDDSKSARAFLTRLLEEQSVEVDSAENAEQGIEYLSQRRPDVIFMDHLMPGMDGFQAVQAIKANPRTANIPILMYTSQEGELYLGQARALGAVGVLPKSVGAADVRTVLQQLLLVESDASTVAAQPEVLNAAVAAAAAAALPEEATYPQVERRRGPAVDTLLRAELTALKDHFAAQLDFTTQRLHGEMRAALREAQQSQPEPQPVQVRSSNAPWILTLAAGLIAVVLGTLLWQVDRQQTLLRAELADARSIIAEMAARLTVPADTASEQNTDADSGIPAVVLQVPFGEAPLSGNRVEKLREFVTARIADHAGGTVEVRRYAGRFCLAAGNEGYRPADAATPYSKCDLVADANDPTLGAGTPESVAFASLLVELRKQAGDAIHIEVQEGRPEIISLPYPETAAPGHALTAGEWNAAAAANNRVEIRWQPAT